MRRFRVKAKLQEMFLQYIINMYALSEEFNYLNKLFFAMDTDGDGRLNKGEINQMLKMLNNKEEEIFSDEGELSYSGKNLIYNLGFIMASIDKNKILSDYNLSRAFSSMDRFGTGILSFKELKYCFGLDVPEDIWRKLIG